MFFLLMMLVFFAAITIFDRLTVKSSEQTLPSIEATVDQHADQKAVSVPSALTLRERIDAYLYEQAIDSDALAIYIHVFDSGEEYRLNSERDFVAASLYKLPLAMLYYDRQRQGEVSLQDGYRYLPIHDEGFGNIAAQYEHNTDIPLGVLLHEMIASSDNTAGHILYENLNGWLGYRQLSARYINTTIEPSFYTYDNITTAHYMSDTLRYLYEHASFYTDLIKDLYDAMPGQYLNLYLPMISAQKYGWYGDYVHAAGIVFDGRPYSIVVLTRLGEAGAIHIGAINRICYAYLNG